MNASLPHFTDQETQVTAAKAWLKHTQLLGVGSSSSTPHPSPQQSPPEPSGAYKLLLSWPSSPWGPRTD